MSSHYPSCPRCGRNMTQRFYGPCGDCREDLAQAFSEENNRARQVAARAAVSLWGPLKSYFE